MSEETLSARAVALALERYRGRPEVAAEVERRIREPLALARIQAARDGLTAATMGEALKSREVREAEALARLVDAAAGVAPRAPAVTPAAPAPSASPAPCSEAMGTEPAEARQARRYQMCVDAGLTMPSDTYARLPRGIHQIAKAEGITRQALAEDLKAHIGRVRGR